MSKWEAFAVYDRGKLIYMRRGRLEDVLEEIGDKQGKWQVVNIRTQETYTV
jgi:hypothetical protein